MIRRTFAAEGSHGVDAPRVGANVVVLAFVNIVAAFAIRCQLITRRAFAMIITRDVHAAVGASAVRERALVDVDAGFLVLSQFVARWTGAEVAADGVCADVRAFAVVLSTLVNVQAGGFIGMQIMSLVARAHIIAQQVHAIVRAIVLTGQTLVHIHAISLVVQHQNISGGTFAMITAFGIYTRVRAAGVHVVLKFLALIDILASPAIGPQAETKRTGATNARISIGAFLLVTMMRAIAVIALAAVHKNAGSIVTL